MPNRKMPAAAFERLEEQMATAVALCSEDQMLTLADHIHDAIRRRQNQRWEGRSFERAGPVALDA